MKANESKKTTTLTWGLVMVYVIGAAIITLQMRSIFG